VERETYMILPYSEQLNIGNLNRLFENTSNCYKFFWFQALIKNVSKDRARFSFNEILDEMIVDAWYMVTEYHLRLGPLGVKDNLEEVVKYIAKTYSLSQTIQPESLMNFLQSIEDSNIINYKKELIKNVPFRLLSPFLTDETKSPIFSCSIKQLVECINQQKGLPYYFVLLKGVDSEIEMGPIWVDYFLANKGILLGWIQFKLIHYLQSRNPSVPGISEKIEPPISRDLDRVRKYWRIVIQADPSIQDIFSGKSLNDSAISIDHFVPWQYVAHDELWNLHPIPKEVNSSKNNNLPLWSIYSEPFCELEYRAYCLSQNDETVSREFGKIAPYHLNNEEIRVQLYAPGLSRVDFSTRLANVVLPVYESAKNQGFKEWVWKE